MYEPILEFKASELIARWTEIYELLSVEKLRARIETDLKAMYDKLCQSSLDKDYPVATVRFVLQFVVSQRPRGDFSCGFTSPYNSRPKTLFSHAGGVPSAAPSWCVK